jgi:hypothetical protein
VQVVVVVVLLMLLGAVRLRLLPPQCQCLFKDM